MEKRLFARWLWSCAIDYALLVAAFLAFALVWPGGGAPLRTVILIVLTHLLYQPLGELLGGTLGQRLAGIRLLAPGTLSTTSLATVARRHGERIAIFWGVLAAWAYWRRRPDARPAPASDWQWEQRRR